MLGSCYQLDFMRSRIHIFIHRSIQKTSWISNSRTHHLWCVLFYNICLLYFNFRGISILMSPQNIIQTSEEFLGFCFFYKAAFLNIKKKIIFCKKKLHVFIFIISLQKYNRIIQQIRKILLYHKICLSYLKKQIKGLNQGKRPTNLKKTKL